MDFLSWNHAGYALACALVVMMAFLMGRNWEQSHSHISVATNNGSAKERIVLFVIDDHLNRSERLLVELKHADAIDVRSSQSIQKEARELLAENQLYMQSTAQPDNPALAAVLDHLGRVLVEVANEPDGLTPQKIARLQKEMNTSGLLFQIRVLRTKVNGQANHYSGQTKGTTI